MLHISVIDSGAGISAENQKKLFKEVIQFNPEKLQSGGGSGFGLYICKGIVDLHEGFLSVFSEGEGLGSTFTVQLPMKKETQQPCSPLISLRLQRVASDVSRSKAISRRIRQGSVGSLGMGSVVNSRPNFVTPVHQEVEAEKEDSENEEDHDETPQVSDILLTYSLIKY